MVHYSSIFASVYTSNEIRDLTTQKINFVNLRKLTIVQPPATLVNRLSTKRSSKIKREKREKKIFPNQGTTFSWQIHHLRTEGRAIVF